MEIVNYGYELGRAKYILFIWNIGRSINVLSADDIHVPLPLPLYFKHL
jgi:hypothetical protein